MDNEFNLLFDEANKLHKTGSLKEAKIIYEKLLEDEPSNSLVNHNLGLLLVSLNQRNDALFLLKKAIEFEINNHSLWISYLQILINEKLFGDALKIIFDGRKRSLPKTILDSFEFQIAGLSNKKEIEFFKNSIFAENVEEIIAEVKAENYQKAEKLSSFLTEEFPHRAFGFKALGMILFKGGKLSEALIATQKASLLDNKDATVQKHLGDIFKQLNSFDESEMRYQRALDLNSNDAQIFYELGDLYFKNKKYKESEFNLNKALELNPILLDAIKQMRKLLQSQRKYKEAGIFEQQENVLEEYFEETRNSQKKIDHKSVLINAKKLYERNFPNFAIAVAEKDLPDEIKPTKNILEANIALRESNQKLWLEKLNNYLVLSDFGQIKIKGKNAGNIIKAIELINAPVPASVDGPLITVIIPVWNGADTIETSVSSILNQTWQNLELIIVDDFSDDNTWNVLQRLSKKDKRIILIKNNVNVGPYVSKNRALLQAKGEWITGQDADDWSHPLRLERQINFIHNSNYPFGAISYMVRLKPNGEIDSINRVGTFSPDGVKRKASITTFFSRKFINEKLGFWDMVRFGGDSEMIFRAELASGLKISELPEIVMLCLSDEGNLTNDPINGISNGELMGVRQLYRDNYRTFHNNQNASQNYYFDFPQKNRKYSHLQDIVVDYNDVMSAIK